MLSRLLVCKTILFDRGYFIQGAFTNIFQGLFKACVHNVNSNLQIGAQGRLRVRVLSSVHAHFEKFRPSNLKRVLRTENSYSQSPSYCNLKVANVCHATVGHFCPEMHVNTMKSPLKSMPKAPVGNTMVSAIKLMKFLLNFGWKLLF